MHRDAFARTLNTPDPRLKESPACYSSIGCARRLASARLAMAVGMVLHFLIQGRVQGVGFRWFVQREASELALRGWVRNTEDGHVEVVAAGEADDLAELRTSLRKGPRGSRVDRVVEHTLAESEAEALSDFRIEGAW
jgi:acylphosphatase